MSSTEFLVGEGPFCPFDTKRVDLSFGHYEAMLRRAIARGYRLLTVDEAISRPPGSALTLTLRHDVDLMPERVEAIAEIEERCGVRGSYFFRVVANEYNINGYAVRRLIDRLLAAGHEVGLHAEPVDEAAAIGMTPLEALEGQIAILKRIMGPFHGVAAHNDQTPNNNLAFLQSDSGRAALASERLYEAYGGSDGLFGTSIYFSDGHPWYWRVFDHGTLQADHACLCGYAAAGRGPLYLLTHPHLWYRFNFHLGSTGPSGSGNAEPTQAPSAEATRS